MKNSKYGHWKKVLLTWISALLSTTMLFSFVGCKDNGGQTNGLVPEYPPYEEPVTPGGNQQTQPEDPSTTPVDPTPGKDDKEPDDQEPDDPGPQNPDDQNPDDKEPDDQKPDDKPVEKFSYAENRDKIIENVMTLIDYCKYKRLGAQATVDKVYDIYLEKSENSQYVDTLGAVFAGKTRDNDLYFTYETITIPVNQDLSYQFLSENNQTSTKGLTLNSKYYFTMSSKLSVEYSAIIAKMQKTLFENYDNALWLGWRGFRAPQNDEHTFVVYDGHKIQETYVLVKNDGSTLDYVVGGYNKYFANNQYTEWKERKTVNIEQKTLNDCVLEESQEAEQQ